MTWQQVRAGSIPTLLRSISRSDMISAPTALVLPRVRLTDRETAAFQQAEAKITAAIRDGFDGTPARFTVDVSARIAVALKRRFEMAEATDRHRWDVSVVEDGSNYTLLFRVVPNEAYAPASAPNGKATPISAAPPKPTLSVIFGTFNRFEHLKRAVESVRRSVVAAPVDGIMTRVLPYEIVVCDGGSADGSREWLAAQADVIMVGERRLDGAVAAFNQCFALARGEYIANLNDDCAVEGAALSEGVRYLQEHPEAGQVAFGFNLVEGHNGVNSIYPTRDYPTVTWDTTYANFGIIRRSVADAIAAIQGGFWNPVYRTYAADCELSAWVHRLGFQVAALPHLRIVDTRAEDGLRERNNDGSGNEAKQMYARWPADAFRPDGPEPRVSPAELERFRKAREGTLIPAPSPAADPLVQMVELIGWPHPEEERRLRRIAPAIRVLDPIEGQFPKRADSLRTERVLHVHLGTDADPQAGLVRALASVSGFRNMEWRGSSYLQCTDGDGIRHVGVRWPDFGHSERQERIALAASVLRPTLVFMQLQTANAVDVETVRRIRELADPSCVIATWCGDIASENSPWNVNWQAALGRVVDLTLHSSMSHVRALRAAGVHNAGYLQIGYDEEQYRPYHDNMVVDPDSADRGRVLMPFDHDVAFLGSRYGSDVFSQSMRRHDAELRDEVVAKMREAFGDRFGLFGNGWNATRNATCRRCGKPEREFGLTSNECQDAVGTWGVHDVGSLPVCSWPLARSHEVYWRSRIGLNISLANTLDCYTSDRLFRIMGCGSLLLTKRFPGMSVLGLVDGENCLVFENAAMAAPLAQAALGLAGMDSKWGIGPEDATRIAAAGAALARERHTWNARMLELQCYVDAVRGAR